MSKILPTGCRMVSDLMGLLISTIILVLIFVVVYIVQNKKTKKQKRDFSEYEKYLVKDESTEESPKIRTVDESKRSLLKVDHITITDKISIRLPTVGEILEDEQSYYSLVSSLTASPFQYMVQLDDMGIDFTKINDYELFLMMFPAFAKGDTSFIFGDLDVSDAGIYQKSENDAPIIYCPKSGIVIDALTYVRFTDALRKINLLEKDKSKPGNENARKYLLEKERRKQKRRKNKPYEPYLEKLVIALVNTSEFPYDYDSCMNLSIYKFNQSLKQIQRKINFDNTMTGVFAGTIDTKKMSNKDGLSWIPIK